MMDKLAKTLVNMQSKPLNNFFFGVVTKSSPLEISVQDFPTIQGAMLILGNNCKDFKDYKDGELVYRNLEKGDNVFMIASNNDQQYYVCEVLL